MVTVDCGTAGTRRFDTVAHAVAASGAWPNGAYAVVTVVDGSAQRIGTIAVDSGVATFVPLARAVLTQARLLQAIGGRR